MKKVNIAFGSLLMLDEGSEVEKIHSKEATELSDQWKPTDEEMWNAFKELQKVVNDLANKS